ncbi:carbonic anhydrase family protein [Acinetobacter sp.]|uniref:carbonic anhydrase n=1 Tax=Acinetobacter sp. TaxID=472 RepID=UPI0031CF1142
MIKPLLVSLLTTVSITSVSFAAESIQWGYDAQLAPEHWADLAPQYQLCRTGKNQAPINIQKSYRSIESQPLQITYPSPLKSVIFDGHTLQADSKSPNNTLHLDQQTFVLQQLHLHTPSENKISGKSYPLELHLVHQNPQGELAVVAVMMKLGAANPALTEMLSPTHFPKNQTQPLKSALHLNSLLPKQRYYYRFSGSLTTPPCSEGVTWLVLKQPLTLSPQQLKKIQTLLQHANNRPVQPLHGRTILEN